MVSVVFCPVRDTSLCCVNTGVCPNAVNAIAQKRNAATMPRQRTRARFAHAPGTDALPPGKRDSCDFILNIGELLGSFAHAWISVEFKRIIVCDLQSKKREKNGA